MVSKYVGIVDAGSTSSRLLIYKWEAVAHADRYKSPLKFTKVFYKEQEGKHILDTHTVPRVKRVFNIQDLSKACLRM